MSLTYDELKRLADAATLGEWVIDVRYQDDSIVSKADANKPHGWCADPKRFANEYAHPIAQSRGVNENDWWLIIYLHNHIPEILEALRDRERHIEEGMQLAIDVIRQKKNQRMESNVSTAQLLGYVGAISAIESLVEKRRFDASGKASA